MLPSMPPILKRFSRSYNQSYQPLPTGHSDVIPMLDPEDDDTEAGKYAKPIPARRRCCGPYCVLKAIGLLAVFGTVIIIVSRHNFRKWSGVPDYLDIRKYELELKQHNMDLPFPEGKDGRFVKFDAAYNTLGWNNALQDIIMLSQVAYASGRAKVFHDYIWSVRPNMPIVIDNDLTPRSARIPLNAFLGGPLAGGSWARGTPVVNGTIGDHGSKEERWHHFGSHPNPMQVPYSDRPPRFIAEVWWDQVCPPERRKIVNGDAVIAQIGSDQEGSKILNTWVELLGGLNDTCVQVTGDHPFSFYDYGSTRLLSTFDALRESPVLKQFQWSPLVQQTVQQNLNSFDISLRHDRRPNKNTPIPSKFPGLLAIHVRRGDFEAHCKFLAKYSASYNAWNSFPDYLDHPPSNTDDYGEHCFPTINQILYRVRKVQWEWELAHKESTLKRIYVMTNANKTWYNELKMKLEYSGWEVVSSAKDLEVSPKAVEVVVGADMMIATLAEVFIGNGFSSLSSNVNLFRRARGLPSDSIRFL